jgi:hypothetical protein
MPVDTADRIRNAVRDDCPTTEWAFDKGKDLILKGHNKEIFHEQPNECVFYCSCYLHEL